jgi:ADP-ribose pyrophosphatase YjhB (NUDIX family)
MTAIETNGLLLVVAAALVDPDGRVLVAQRPEGKSMGGLWEFPGGKVEAGEAPEAALIRELHEDLGIAVKEPCLAPLGRHPARAGACGAQMAHAAGASGQRGRLAHARGRLASASHAARSLVKTFAADAGGATSIEYTLCAMLIAAVIITVVTTIGGQVNGMIASVEPGLR